MSTDNMTSYDPHGNGLSIFVSNADIRSTDIDKMSDFIGMGIKKLADALVVSEAHPIVDVHSLDIPAAGEALSLGRVLTRNGYEYVLTIACRRTCWPSFARAYIHLANHGRSRGICVPLS